MAVSHLVINANRTQLIVMGTRKTTARRNEVSLVAEPHIIEHTRTNKLLLVRILNGKNKEQ